MNRPEDIWIIIVALGVGSFGLRFAFLGIIGDRTIPEWLMRHLRYTAVAILPGLIAPLVLWPSATGGAMDPVRLVAAGTTLALSLMTGRIVISIFGGAIVLALMLQFA